MGKFMRPLCLIGIALVLSGCIAYGGRLPGAPMAAPPPAAGGKPTIAVTVDASTYLPQEEEHEPTPSESRRIGKYIAAGLEGTGHFSSITMNEDMTEKAADITMKMDVVKQYKNSGILNFLWWFTSFLVPAYAKEYYDFRIEVTDSRSGHVFTREIHTDITSLFQLFLLPATPFLIPERKQAKLMGTIAERMVAEMAGEGMLQGGVPARLSRVSHPAPYAIDN